MSTCIFCKIVNKEIPADIVYEDDLFVAFLDINPVTDGHVLLIPKAHHVMMTDAPDDIVGAGFVVAKKLMSVIQRAMMAEFITLSVVGKDVPHFHIHLIPRYSDDGLAGFWPTKKYAEGEASEIAQKIKAQL